MNSVIVNEVLNEYSGKIDQKIIVGVCEELDLINSIVKYDCDVKVMVKEYLNIELEKLQIHKNYIQYQSKLNELSKKSLLIKNNKIDKLRLNGNIESFLNTLNKDKLNSLLRLGLIRSEEMSNIELRRFKENQNNFNMNYNELERENISTSNNKIWN